MDSIRSTTEAKLSTGKQKKDAGDQAFRKGDNKEGMNIVCLILPIADGGKL
jgi:hypothetical protein